MRSTLILRNVAFFLFVTDKRPMKLQKKKKKKQESSKL